MKKLILLLVITSFFWSSCESGNEGEEVEAPCPVESQGFSFEAVSDSGSDWGNVNFDNNAIVVQLVTGGSQGDYYHIYSTTAPIVDFYTYAINTGDTSGLTTDWNTTAGSYLSIGGEPIADPSLTLTMTLGGNAVGDFIQFNLSGIFTSEDEEIQLDIDACVNIDTVTEIPASCSSVAIEYSINGVTTSHVESVTTAEIWDASNYTVGKNVYDIWTDEGSGFYYHSSASNTGDTSTFVSDWQTTEGSHLIIPGFNFASSSITFTTTQEATAIGELVTIEFDGTFGIHTINGTICTVIDIYNP